MSEACTLDANLRRLLAVRFPGKSIKVFNLGNGAWKSLQELIAIQRFGLDIKPDLIIAFNGFNDIEHSYSSAIGAPYAGWRMWEAFNRYAEWTLGGPLASFQGLRIVSDLRDLLSDWSFARFFSALGVRPLPGACGTTAPGLARHAGRATPSIHSVSRNARISIRTIVKPSTSICAI